MSIELQAKVNCSRREWYQKGYQDGLNANRWIPVEERLPEEDEYILLSFANFILPAIGRYEKNNDGSGNFYLGDKDKTLLSYGLFVNAWMPLPEPYREE